MKKSKNMAFLRKILIVLVSLFFYSLAYNLLALPFGIVSGGTSGLAQVLYKIFRWSPSLVVMIANITCLLVSLFTIGKKETLTGAAVSILFPIMIWLTSFIKIDVSTIDPLIVVVIIAIVQGVVQGTLEKENVGQGGMLQLSKVIQKKFNYSFNKANFQLNLIIILAGFIAYGLNSFILAIILIYIQSLVADKVLLGISNKKAFYIITSEDDKVQNFIRNEMKRGASIISIKGGYNNQKDEIILTVIPTNEYFILKNGVLNIDSEAFILVTDSYEVKGGV